MFTAFVGAPGVRLIGVEAGGRGTSLGEHCASLTQGEPGILHGALSYLLQDDDGQVADTHSISAGLDYPGVGPEHAYLRDAGLAEYVSASDDDALAGFQALARDRGDHPRARAGARDRLAPPEAAARGLVGPRLPVGARRQGPRHGPGAPRDDLMGRLEAASARPPRRGRARLRPVRDGRVPGRGRRPAPAARRRRSRRDRGRHPVLGPGHGRRA